MRYILALMFILTAVGIASASSDILGKIGRYSPYGFTGRMPITGGIGSGSGPPPPVCSDALDFSEACNSQYIPTL